MRGEDTRVHASLRTRRFELTFNPLDFVDRVFSVRDRAPSRGHLVLVPRGVRTDYAVAARLAAALLGAHMATSDDYLAKGRESGCKYAPSYNCKGPNLTLAVSAAISEDFPTARALLLRIAQAPGSRMELARSARELEKKFKKAAKKTPTGWRTAGKNHRIWATQSERNEADKKYRALYSLGDDFLRIVQTPVRDAVCPGF